MESLCLYLLYNAQKEKGKTKEDKRLLSPKNVALRFFQIVLLVTFHRKNLWAILK